ncbi:MAG: NTP transferase domain-containing protein, partial [Burkholderiales bacterium]
MIAGVLLAAGASSRFGSNKLLHPLPDGTPIAVAAGRNLKRAVEDAFAVVRSHDEALA